MNKWINYSFNEVIYDDTKNGTKIKKESYLNAGQYPVIDQGKELIAGYQNDDDGLYKDIPAIIFGDHTRIIKYIDFPFFLGADGVKLLKAKNKDIDYKYLYYFFSKREVPNTGYNRHFKWLKELNIPIPPLETQKQIAKILDTASELLFMRKQQLAELDNLIKSVFYDMFEGFTKYNSVELIKIITEGAGLSYGIVQPGEDIADGVGVIRPIDIRDGVLYLDKVKHVSKTIEIPYKKTRLTGNEILITVRGTTGNTVLADDKSVGMNVTRGIAVIRQNNELVNKVFLNEYLKSEESQRYIQENTKGATLKQINLTVLKGLKIPLPPMSIQNEFATIVTKIEEQKTLVKKAIDETQLLFDSLMNQYFD